MNNKIELHYWEFNTNLTASQWRTLNYLKAIHETSNDQECNEIIGKYLDSIKVPKDFEEEVYEE